MAERLADLATARRPMMIGDESLGYEVPMTW
jgi:hypothetical protein